MQNPPESPPKARRLSTTLATAFFSMSAAVLFLYSALVIYHDLKIRQAVILNRQLLAAQAAAKTVSSFLNENFSILETTIWLTNLDALSEAEQRDILQSLLGLRSAIRRLVLLNARHQVLAQASRLSMQTSNQFTNQLKDFLPVQEEHTQREISPVYIDAVTSEPMVTIAVPMINVFGDFKGMLIAELNLKFMWDIVDQLRVGDTGYVYVTDRQGNLLAFQDTARVLKGENLSHIKSVADFIRSHASAQPSTATIYHGIEGSTVVGTFAPLKTPDWAVVTELPWKEAYRPTFQDIAAASGITLAVAVLAGMFGIFVAKHLAGPVIKLTQTASRIASGERDLQAAVGGPEEVAHLAVAFNSMTAQLRQSLTDLEQQFAELKRTENALRISEERLRLALEGTSDGIWDWNTQTDQVYFSPRYYTMMGYEPNEFPGTYENWRNLLHPDDAELAEMAVQRAIEERSQFVVEFRFRAKNGDWRWILGRGKVVESDMTGQAVRVAGSHTDITDRKQAEMALLESEQKFRAVVENSQPIIFMLDPNGVFQLSEGQGLAKLGLAPGQVVGQSVFEVYRDVPSVMEGVKLALEGKTKRTINVLGEMVFDTVYSPYLTPDGRQNGVVGIAIDITERTRAEAAAKEHQDRLALALHGADLGSWDWNIQSGEIRINERWAEMLGYRVEEIDPNVQSWKALVHPEDLPHVLETLTAHLDGRTPFYETEHRMRHKSGYWIWVLDRGKVIQHDTTGRPVRAAGTHLDVTERKRSEEALEKRILALTRPLDSAEGIAFEDLFKLSDIQRLQDLYAEAFGVAALMTRPDGSPITQPSNFTELCGEIIRKTPQGVKNCNYSDAMIGRHNPTGPNIQPCLSAGLCNAGASITVGGYHVANWLIGQVRNESQKEEEDIMQYAREIGADEAAFRAAYRKVPSMSQEKFEKVAHVLFELANQISTTAYQNVQQARFITERKRAEEALRKYERIVSTSQDLMALVNRDYKYEAVNESMLKAFDRPRGEVVGHALPECIGERVFREKIQSRIDQALSGQTVHFQESLDFAGIGRRIMDIRYIPFFGETGEVGGVVLNARDITETRKLEEQLTHSQKIESIGTLAGGVAHEINNPINGIMNYAQLILDGMKEQSPVTEYAQEILHETQRIAKIVRNLLTFARREKQLHSPALLSDIVSAVLSLIQTVMRRDQIDLRVEIPNDLPRIKCRSQQIQQVLMNLMTNSRDALNEKYPGYSEEKKLRVFAEVIEKQGRRFIRTTVEDSGKGIPWDILDRIFDPFFTTKPKETGTGLGLSISYGIVKDHGGELSVESEPDEYTRFHMDLPVDNGWILFDK